MQSVSHRHHQLILKYSNTIILEHFCSLNRKNVKKNVEKKTMNKNYFVVS